MTIIDQRKVINRSQHYTDVLENKTSTSNNIRRIIENWINYRIPESLNINRLINWQETKQDVELALTGTPDHWMGNFDFRYQALNGPIQVFIGDTTDARNTALLGVRKAENPRAWMNIKFLGVNNDVEMEVFPSIKAVRWQDLYTNTNLGFKLGRHKVEKKLNLKRAGHPFTFRFALRIPDEYSYELTADYRILIKDENGEIQLTTRPPFAQDSSLTSLETVEGNKIISTDLIEDAPITIGLKQFPTFKIRISPDECATAIYPIILDPTVTISGTNPSIEDNNIANFVPNNNYGGSPWVAYGRLPIGYYRALYRIDESEIPAGTITALRLYHYRSGWSGQTTQAGTSAAYIYKDANTWVEGASSGGSAVAGTSCWNYAKYSSQAWAGSVGGNTSGTDYDADASPPGSAYPAKTSPNLTAPFELRTETLLAAWATAWRDATRVNNGFFLRDLDEDLAGKGVIVVSSEGASPPYFEIDYSAAAASNTSYIFLNALKKKIL